MKTIYIQDNDFTFEMELCMDVWLNGCMRNDPKKIIKMHLYKFFWLEYIQSYLTTAETGKINR